MNVCVNLLKPSEARYQGAVSREFALRVSVGAVVAFLLLMVVIGLANHRSTLHQLQNSKASWTEMEPRYEQIKEMQTRLAAKRVLQDELKGWNTSRVEWNKVLGELQAVVPPSVQLTKLSIRGEFRLLKENAADPEDPGRPARQFLIRLDGRTAGALADEVAVQFVRTIRDGEVFLPLLETVKLQGLQRMATTGGEQAHRLFGVEGITYSREM